MIADNYRNDQTHSYSTVLSIAIPLCANADKHFSRDLYVYTSPSVLIGSKFWIKK